jgi:iron(III) transport system ATP-binding protein
MIRITSLSRRFGTTGALTGISLEIPDGGSLAVTGPSGSGKTTLLRLIAGLDTPDQGQIWFDGTLVSDPGWALPPNRRSIGFVFQTPALWPHMTVAGNILFAMSRLPRAEQAKRLAVLLEKAGISSIASRYPHQISGGEARRVSILRALAPQPRYLLMDEPLVNLDPDLKVDLLNMIRDFVDATSVTLVYVTHDPAEVKQFDIPHVQLRNGRLVATPQGRAPE